MGSEQKTCLGCGKLYWHPGQVWQHKDCVVRTEAVGKTLKKSKAVALKVGEPEVGRPAAKHGRQDREAYNAYMREYMRKKYAEKKGKA